MKLIIVEGIPGSGKSSAARFIALQSERNGLETMLYHESAFQHPIFVEHDVIDSSEWRTNYLSNWDHFFANQENNNSVTVIESILFQNPIMKLLHLDIDRGEILRFIDELYSRLISLNCTLIYLHQEDHAIGIHRMMMTRGGEAWLHNTYEKYKHEPYYLNRGQLGVSLHLDFLHEYAVLALTAYEKYGLNKLAIDNTSWDWPTYHKKILNFLNLTYVPDPILKLDELERYVGTYRNKEIGISVRIELKENELVIFGDHRLKPRDRDQFYLENISVSLEYNMDINGKHTGLLITEKDIVGNRNDEGTKFERIT